VQVGELFARLKLDRSEFDEGLKSAEGQAERSGGLISRALGAGKVVLGGALLGGVAALGTGLFTAAAAGLSFNNSLEQTRAKISAFTGDAAKTEEILAMVQQRAKETPFAFDAMAEAAAALIPSANQSGVALEELIAQAEILAASNPAEGLEGAAFALKEAVSGDFASVIERFNLPRQRLNELKEQGVPALEAVKIAMAELGLSSELVTNMAGTLEGRWGAFTDTLTGLASRMTQPIFDAASNGLARLTGLLDENAPKLEALADLVAGKFSAAITWAGSLFGQAGDASSVFSGKLDALSGAWDSLRSFIEGVTPPIRTVIQTVFSAIGDFLHEHGDEIAAFLRKTWQSIGVIVKLAVDLLNATIVPAFKVIASFIGSHGKEITALFSNAWTAIQAVITIALALIQGVLRTALALIRGDWQGAWNAIREMLATIWDSIQRLVSAAVGNLQVVLSLAWDAIRGVAGSAWDGIKGAITGAFDATKTALSSTVESIKGTLSGAWETIKNGARSAWEGIASVVGSAFSGAVGSIKGTLNSIISTMNRAINGFNELPGPDLPTIPKLAKGTNFFQGGMALVGEQGPELVFLPRGSRVVPNAQTEQMLAGGSQVVNHWTVNANYAYQPERRLRDDVRMLQLMGAGL
jgi:hypothetical protein